MDKVAKATVAIPIPSGEGQNLERDRIKEMRVRALVVAIPIPSGEGQNQEGWAWGPMARKLSQYLYLLVKVRTPAYALQEEPQTVLGRNTYTFW